MAYVFEKVKEPTVTPTVTAGAYSAADVVGGLLTFSGAFGPSGVGILNRVRVVDDANQKAVLTLYLFNDAPSTIADNAAFAPVVADLKKLVAKVAIAADDYTELNSNAVALIDDINDTVLDAGGKGALYGYLVCTATPTYAATTDVQVQLSILTS